MRKKTLVLVVVVIAIATVSTLSAVHPCGASELLAFRAVWPVSSRDACSQWGPGSEASLQVERRLLKRFPGFQLGPLRPDPFRRCRSMIPGE
jgi:hypothetical protein